MRPWTMLGLCSLLALGGCAAIDIYTAGRSHAIAPYEAALRDGAAQDPDAIGAARFAFDDLQGLSTDTMKVSALPWKVAATALVLHQQPGVPPTPAALRAMLQRFGFFVPTGVRNWPTTRQPTFDMPMGLVTGDITRRVPPIRIEVATIGCASCHGGTLYDARGTPTLEAWLGTPNTSLDLDAYAGAMVDGLRAAARRPGATTGAYASTPPDALMQAIPQLFPLTTPRELDGIRRFVWPRLGARLAQLDAQGGALPFRNGGPGRTNGTEALKSLLGVPLGNVGDTAAVSIPGVADRRLRSSLLADGFYAPEGQPRFVPRTRDAGDDPHRLAAITAFFTVGTMSVEPERVPKVMPQFAEIMQFLDGHAAAPPFPGPIDAALAARGAATYDQRCAGCHGRYAERDGRPRLVDFPNTLVPIERIGTDPARLDSITPAAIAAAQRSTLDRYVDVADTGGYVAPILTGVWASAPYLHNGSVPTLWHLLNPDQRPARFMVGGHGLDLDKVGVRGRSDARGDWAYDADYVPWSKPQWFDTSLPGRSRGGHERQVEGIGAGDQRALLEYLKGL